MGPCVLAGVEFADACGLLFEPGASVALPWFKRSHISTNESSPPDASVPLREGDHSIQLIAAACPLSSSNAWPG